MCKDAPFDGVENPALAWVTRLVHEHRAHLARVARREGLSPEDAFDAVQEAFHALLTMPQRQDLAAAPEDARKLLVTLTRNIARNRRRLHAVARPHDGDQVVEGLASPAPSVQELLETAEESLRLMGCVKQLADAQRAVVTLRMLDEVPGDDVARTLGITPGHVAVLLHRAKVQLLACLVRADEATSRSRIPKLS